MKLPLFAVAAVTAAIALPASAAEVTIQFNGADIVAQSPATVNNTGTPAVGDGKVEITTAQGTTTYTTYAGPKLDQAGFDGFIGGLSPAGQGVSWVQLWLQDGHSNQAAMWGETIALNDPYSDAIEVFAPEGWEGGVYTLGNEWGSAWTGRKLIQYWTEDPTAYLKLGSEAVFGFRADIVGNDGATGPEYQMWVGAGNDAYNTGDVGGYFLQRAVTAAVPEPTTMALAALALLGLGAVRRRA